jgi:4-amino-4-deoxy-L-arabinose transferase-like glycosyltransferase
MVKNNKYFVYTKNDTIEHHNTKPPLVLWLQSASYKVFGINEFAVRFPTYAAIIGVCLLFFYHSLKLFSDSGAGAIASLALLTTGAMRPHIFLTGDLDGILVFFTTAIFLHFIAISKSSKITNRQVYHFLVLFLLGYFTKSTAILLTIPSLLVCFLLARKLIPLVKKRSFYLSVLIFFLVVAGYYYLREQVDKGYWDRVWFSEFQRAVKNIQPWVSYPRNFYFDNLWHEYSHFHLLFLAILVPVFFIIPLTKYKKEVLYLALSGLLYLVVITIPDTKLNWYEAPVYPIIAFIMGIIIHELLRVSLSSIRSEAIKESLTFAVIILIFVIPFRTQYKMAGELLNQYIEPESAAKELKELVGMYPSTQKYVILEKHHEPQDYNILYFYRTAMSLKSNKSLVILKNVSELGSGDSVLCCQREVTDSISTIFDVQILHTFSECKYLRIK